MVLLRRISGKYWMELSSAEAMELKAKEGDSFALHTAPKGLFILEPTLAQETPLATLPILMPVKPMNENKTELKQPLMDKAVIRTEASTSNMGKNSYLLSKSGFLFTKNEGKANELSQQFYAAFKEKKVRGLKDFDGTFYVFDESAYQQYVQQAASYMKEQKKVAVEDLAAHFGWSADLTRGLCCFLKEDGMILEKKKGTYQYIE